MKRLRILPLFPLMGMLVHRRFTPALNSSVPIIHLGGKVHCESRGKEPFSKLNFSNNIIIENLRVNQFTPFCRFCPKFIVYNYLKFLSVIIRDSQKQ